LPAISVRWCDFGMEKRCRERLGTNSSLNEQRLISAHHRLNALRSQNIALRLLAVRTRAQPLPLYLYTMLYMRVRPPSFLSRSLSLFALAPPPPPCCAQAPPPAGRARSHPTFSA
jgi:hypothetical protein